MRRFQSDGRHQKFLTRENTGEFFIFTIHQIRKKSADRLMLFSGTLYRDCMQRWQCRIHNGTPNPLTDVFSLIYTNILCLQVLIFKLINIQFLELAEIYLFFLKPLLMGNIRYEHKYCISCCEFTLCAVYTTFDRKLFLRD